MPASARLAGGASEHETGSSMAVGVAIGWPGREKTTTLTQQITPHLHPPEDGVDAGVSLDSSAGASASLACGLAGADWQHERDG